MTRDDSVRTDRGELVVRDGEVRIRTTPRGAFREEYLGNWTDRGLLRRGLYVVTTLFTVGTFADMVRDVFGFSDRLLSVGTIVSLGVVLVTVIGLRWSISRLRRDSTIPLSAIREVERERANGKRDGEGGTEEPTLRFIHTPESDDEETEIEFPSEEAAGRAAQLLRYKGVHVFDLDDWSRRTEIEGSRDGNRREKRETETN
ncbi:hypothetical protein [Haladaptatus sp. T7]|uniref:hypothetical protein n=1 Tax=Haladaptatus sp. T7 TaxID=2029368 RepID=UPI0021A25B61|nr:hypothetical protein [Haladaptatus sp. T7]GKZ13862.1 hypothetical protein HAL_17430 [Haladaptatus sp. T7]